MISAVLVRGRQQQLSQRHLGSWQVLLLLHRYQNPYLVRSSAHGLLDQLKSHLGVSELLRSAAYPCEDLAARQCERYGDFLYRQSLHVFHSIRTNQRLKVLQHEFGRYFLLLLLLQLSAKWKAKEMEGHVQHLYHYSEGIHVQTSRLMKGVNVDETSPLSQSEKFDQLERERGPFRGNSLNDFQLHVDCDWSAYR